MEKKDVIEYKKSYIFKLLENGIDQGQLKDVILGKGKYELSFIPINASTDTTSVICVLHIMLSEQRISNEELNKVFQSIDINTDNVCLLLDYILNYLTYREAENILDIDHVYLYKKIQTKKNDYCHINCFKNLINLIDSRIFI